MERDRRFDFAELNQLRETLLSIWRTATSELDSCDDPKVRPALEQRQAQLENMIERVSESMAMV